MGIHYFTGTYHEFVDLVHKYPDHFLLAWKTAFEEYGKIYLPLSRSKPDIEKAFARSFVEDGDHLKLTFHMDNHTSGAIIIDKDTKKIILGD